MVRVRPAHVGFDASPLLPLGVLVVVIFMVFTPLTMQVVPAVANTADHMFSFVWVVPVIIIAALILTSTEMLAPTHHSYGRRNPPYKYSRNTQQSYYSGESPSWGLLGLMLLMLVLLPWRY